MKLNATGIETRELTNEEQKAIEIARSFRHLGRKWSRPAAWTMIRKMVETASDADTLTSWAFHFMHKVA